MHILEKICSYIVHLNSEISNLALQKLLYYIQAYTLITTGKTAFDAPIEAWTYGPVVPKVYYAFKKNSKTYTNNSYQDLDTNIAKIVKNVVDNLGKGDPFILVKRTHTYDTWINAWNNPIDKEIKPEDILEYHTKRFNEEGSAF